MKAAILGSGSWATSFGRHLAQKWRHVVLWGVEPGQVEAINTQGKNPDFLGDVVLPPNLSATLEMPKAIEDADAIFVVVPSQVVRQVCSQVITCQPQAGIPIINLAKGLELETLKRLSVVISEEVNDGSPEGGKYPVAALLGPSHAEEVACQLPTAVVLTGTPDFDSTYWQKEIAGPFLRVYTNDDLTGVEISSAFKNIIALAVGMADGLGMGDNTRGLLMTRGMTELSRIGNALGGRPETFFGLAGIGDMITTCISRHSRNRNFGEAIASSQEDPQKILANAVQVVEGVVMTKAGLKLAESLQIELPITKQVYDVLFASKPPLQAMRELMDREPRAELE